MSKRPPHEAGVAEELWYRARGWLRSEYVQKLLEGEAAKWERQLAEAQQQRDRLETLLAASLTAHEIKDEEIPWLKERIKATIANLEVAAGCESGGPLRGTIERLRQRAEQAEQLLGNKVFQLVQAEAQRDALRGRLIQAEGIISLELEPAEPRTKAAREVVAWLTDARALLASLPAAQEVNR